MCFPSAPQAPDPVATAQAQVGVNQAAMQGAAALNRTNQVTPFGSLTYSGTPGQADDTLTTSLSPQLQALLTGQTGISQGLTDLSLQRMAGIPTDGFQAPTDPNGYLSAGANSPLQMAQLLDPRANNPLQTTIGDAGPIQGSVNTDFGSQIKQAQDAAYNAQTQYLDPQFHRDQQALQSQLAAQGIPVGSEAYNNAMNQFTEAKNQAYQGAQNAAVSAGNQEQNTLFGQQLGAGQFANAAEAQNYGQLANNAGFYNQAQGQQFGQGMDLENYNLNAIQANNAASGQAFNQGMQIENYNQNEYQRELANMLQGRNQNFNELAAFLNGSPIAPNNPTFQTTPTYNAAQGSPDAVGLTASNYNAANQSRAGLLSSIFGSAGAIGGSWARAGFPCYVAREVYGTETPRWMMFRHWLFTKAPAWFRKLYIAHGEKVALWLHDKPRLKHIVRDWMDARIAAYV